MYRKASPAVVQDYALRKLPVLSRRKGESKMKIKLQIKSRWTGSVLFEYETENNTIKDTLIEAVKNKAYLLDADLRGADLSDADLSDADLRGADLRDADLSDADLSDACLSDADLSGACLSGADLSGACLRGAYLRGAKELPYVPLACPSDGAFIGWKKVGRYLVKLEIPEDAKRSSATTNKCRCDKAKVLDIICISDDHPLNLQEITNSKYTITTYKVGEMAYPDSFDENRWNECSHGIHFFINKQDAISY